MRTLKSTRFLFLLLLLLSLAIVACESDDEGSDDDTTEEVNNGTDVDAVSRDPNLPETFVARSAGVVLSVNYADGWVASFSPDSNTIIIASDESAAAVLDLISQDGVTQAVLDAEYSGSGLSMSPASVSDLELAGIDASVEGYNGILQALAAEDDFLAEIGEFETFEAERFTEAGRAPLTAEGFSGFVYVLVDEDAVISAFAVGDDSENIERTLRTIETSLESPSE